VVVVVVVDTAKTVKEKDNNFVLLPLLLVRLTSSRVVISF